MNNSDKNGGFSVYILFDFLLLLRPTLPCWAPNFTPSPCFTPSSPSLLCCCLLLFYLGQGWWSPLTEASPPLPPVASLGSTLGACQLAFKKRRRRSRRMKKREREREEQHLVGSDTWGVCIFLSFCSLGSMLNLTLILLI